MVYQRNPGRIQTTPESTQDELLFEFNFKDKREKGRKGRMDRGKEEERREKGRDVEWMQR